MKGVKMIEGELRESIKSLYPSPISDAEASEAASNLLSFMELLIKIDREHGITRANDSEVQP